MNSIHSKLIDLDNHIGIPQEDFTVEKRANHKKDILTHFSRTGETKSHLWEILINLDTGKEDFKKEDIASRHMLLIKKSNRQLKVKIYKDESGFKIYNRYSTYYTLDMDGTNIKYPYATKVARDTLDEYKKKQAHNTFAEKRVNCALKILKSDGFLIGNKPREDI